MKTPWRVELYDARVMIIGSYEEDIKRPRSFEIIPAQAHGKAMSLDETKALAEQICAAVNR